jgi:hypothetical protein
MARTYGRVDHLERGRFALWEAVIREEQGLALSRRQERRLDGLFGDDDDDDDTILYVDEIARPPEPWYTSVRRLADALMERGSLGWARLEDAIEAHADELELPDGVECPVDVIPVERRHALRVTERVWEHGRDAEDASSTIDDLRDLVDSVDALGLTPRSLAKLARTDEGYAEALAAALDVAPDDLLAPVLRAP